MAGNLTAFQLGVGAVISIETNQGQVLAIVGNADSAQYSPPPSTVVGGPGLDAFINVSANTNQNILLEDSKTIVLEGLHFGRAQWLQFLIQQGGSGSNTVNFTVAPVGGGARVPAWTPGAAGVPLSTAVGKRDIVSGYWSGGNLFILVAGKDFR